ncbi:MAG: oxalate/formate MFS antiporter, partial [Betaproteobacteria bacterium]|nr:oxalate/formate MFS antiporter [Betaproteobacteria bacterium]
MSALTHPSPGTAVPDAQQQSRWVQLALGVVCMMAISSPQYVWALFTKPLLTQVGASLAELQVTFSI